MYPENRHPCPKIVFSGWGGAVHQEVEGVAICGYGTGFVSNMIPLRCNDDLMPKCLQDCHGQSIDVYENPVQAGCVAKNLVHE